MNSTKFERKKIRLNGYDYSEPGYYFITICTENKKNYFGIIEKERIVKQYKGSITKIINKSIWQKSYFDRIIRNEKEYYKIWKYIDENVLKWQLDVYYNT